VSATAKETNMAENKTKATKKSVSAFIGGLEPDAKRTDARALVKLMQGVTGEAPKLWGPSIIGFGSRHYTYESGREGDIPLIAFSPRKPAIVLYGVAGFTGAEGLLAKVGKHSKSKGCVYLKKLADVDLKILERMVTRAVAAGREATGCIECGKGSRAR
jgi:hypothetical protein